MGKLTEGSNRPEEGWRGSSTVEAELRWRGNGGHSGAGLDSAGERRNQARGVVEEIEGKVDRGFGRLGAQGRLRGGGVWPERRTAAVLRGSARLEL